MSLKSGRADEVKAVGDGGEDGGEVFGDGFGLAGEVDDEGVVSDDGGLAGEDGGGDDGEGGAAHLLAEAGHFAGVGEGEGGFGGDVAEGGAGSAGGEDEVAVLGVHHSEECGADLFGFVGDDGGVFAPRRGDGVLEPLTHCGDCAVGIGAGAGAVGNGEQSDGERVGG